MPLKQQKTMKNTLFFMVFYLAAFSSAIMVEATGFEPTTSWSRTMRATNCATPRFYLDKQEAHIRLYVSFHG